MGGGLNEWDRRCYVGYLSILPPFAIVKYAIQGREVAKTMTEPTEQGGGNPLTSHPAASNRRNPPLYAADVIRPYLIGLALTPEAEYLKSKQTLRTARTSIPEHHDALLTLIEVYVTLIYEY